MNLCLVIKTERNLINNVHNTPIDIESKLQEYQLLEQNFHDDKTTV